MVKEIVFAPQVIKDKLDGRPLSWLAARSGIGAKRLYYIVSQGKDEPTASELIALSRAFDMEPADLMCAAA